ncbi:ABC transporter ATP-binding protein [Gorillibacterium timonense]|uniref:ABC transporter ATP-binding protein n=1 Tax=Gorillibacterium timonense TaxID=1689269 RepID=UPI00071D77F2|nr:ATP-binding cassette domain-containing protein [Gorillibacterium timonense]
MAAIQIQELVKEYRVSVRSKGIAGAVKSLLIPEFKHVRAVDGISFAIEKGETVGFIGPNGAGKSTTVKMLTGILSPTSGSIEVCGMNPEKERKRIAARMGVVFGQKTQLWWDLPVLDTYELLKHIYKIPKPVYMRNLDMFSELLGLQDFIKTPVRQLSLGQKMRADIAAALLHDPEIIFFDEPTIGLDVVAKEKIREFLRYVNREKQTTMLFTTHDMDDIEQTCKRLIIIDHGSKIYDGSMDAIKAAYGKERILAVEFAEKVEPLSYPGVETVDRQGSKLWLKFRKDEIQVSQLINRLSQSYSIVDLTVQEPDIEALIREIYLGGIRIEPSLSGVG